MPRHSNTTDPDQRNRREPARALCASPLDVRVLAPLAWRRIARCKKRLGRAQGGTAIIEFALFGSILSVLLLNVIDVVLLIAAQMGVNYAAQVGTQAAFATCSAGSMPATANCPKMNSAITAAVQSTYLGTAVSVSSGSPSEAYYCIASDGGLQQVGDSSSNRPSNCSTTGDASATPGDYVTVNVDYTFTPLFSGLSIVSAKTLNGSGMQRLQ
jgi:Flp pilus assembly protein TadG